MIVEYVGNKKKSYQLNKKTADSVSNLTHQKADRGQEDTHKERTSKEVWRVKVNQANGVCERCEKFFPYVNGECELTNHHLKPVATHPELVNDLSNIVRVCKKCHAWYHVQPGMGYRELSVKKQRRLRRRK